MPVSANRMHGGNSMPFQGGFDMGELWRVGLWGMAAAAALLVAVFASSTERGNERLMRALSQGRDTAKAPAADPRRALEEKEGQRLADAVRLISADRDALLVRITALESSVRSISDSITRMEQTVRAALAAAPPPDLPSAAPTATAAAPQTVDVTAATPTPEVTATTAAPFDVMTAVMPSFSGSIALPTPKVPPAAPEVPQQATPDSAPDASAAIPLETGPEGPETVTRTKLGLDIGTAKSLEGLRTLWRAAQRRHPMQLEGLHPIVHVRELSRPGGIQLRLVAGPILTAAAAARLCAEIAANGTPCESALFDGQRLALR
jgi:hypothetical protein